MFLKMGSRLQAGGNDVTIGNLVSDADSGGNNNSTIPLNGGVANDGAGTFYAFLENGSNTEGSVTITQTGDHVFTGLIRDGYDPLISSASGELGGEVQNAAELATTEGAALNVVYNGEAEVNLTIATPSTYTGTTIINSGILQAGLGGDGTWNAGATSGDVVGRLGTGDVTVAGGTLAGTGQVQNNLIVDSGFLTPGDESGGTDGVGTLFVGSDTAGTGNVTFNGGTTTFTLQSTPDYNTNISFEDPGYVYTDPNYTTTVTQGVILGTAPATLDPASFGATGSEIGSSYYDHLEVANDLTWNGGTIKVEANGYTPLAGDIFNLIDWFGVEDWTTFNTGGDLLVGNGDDLGDLDLPDLSANPALRWDTRFFMSDGIIFVVAPEPSRLLLLGMGLITLLRRRRARA